MNEPAASHPRTLDRLGPWEREHAVRVAVYATATAHRLGLRGNDLVEIRIAGEAHDLDEEVLSTYSDGILAAIHGPIVRVAEWFDLNLHGSPSGEARPLDEVTADLRAQRGFDQEVVEALLVVQRVIQPVGM